MRFGVMLLSLVLCGSAAAESKGTARLWSGTRTTVLGRPSGETAASTAAPRSASAKSDIVSGARLSGCFVDDLLRLSREPCPPIHLCEVRYLGFRTG